MDINEKINKIKMIVFDFDGVFTDNRVIVNDKGEESVVCSRADGLGLSKLKEIGIGMLILSTEVNAVVQHRAKKLQIECINGCGNKLERLKDISKRRGLDMEEIAFVGNDINDLDCLKEVGLPMVVVDANEEVKKIAKYITKAMGGQGAVREICDLINHIRGDDI